MEKSEVAVGQVRYCNSAQDCYTILEIDGCSATIYWHEYGVALKFVPIGYLAEDKYIRQSSKIEMLLY